MLYTGSLGQIVTGQNKTTSGSVLFVDWWEAPHQSSQSIITK